MLTKIFYYACCVILNRIFCLFPLNDKRVLFLSDVRDDLSGNFKFIYDEIESKYDVRLSLKADRRIRHTFSEWIRQCFYLATSKYILLDDYSAATAYIHVRKHQELVQVWHGSGAYKKFAHSRGGDAGDIKRIHAGYKRYTKAIVSSEYVRPCFAEAFSIPVERVLATGIPRTDIFFNETYAVEKRKAFYTQFPEARGKRIILFAPTYRGTKVEDADYDFDRLDLDQCCEAFGKEYIMLIKWHPALYNNINLRKVKGYDLEKYKGFIYDISSSREINDFLFVTDVLVTDYSSVIFDYALLRKPIVYFAYDIKEYQAGRGLYFPFEEYIYGEIAKTTDQLVQAVKNENFDEEKWRKFVDKFVSRNDGHATDRFINAVFDGRHDI